MTARTPPRWWLPTVVTSVAVAAATLISVRALDAILSPGDWWVDSVRLIALLAVTTTAVRLPLTRARVKDGTTLALPATLGPSIVGLLVGAWAVIAAYGSVGDRFTPAVDMHAVDRVADRLGIAAGLVRDGYAPLAVTLPLTLVAVAGAGFAFLVADLIAAGLRFPSMAVLPLLLLWTAPLVVQGDIPAGVVAGTVVAMAVVIAADTARSAPRARPRLPLRERTYALGMRTLATMGGAAAVAIVALAAGSASSGLPPLRDTPWPTTHGSSGGTVRLSADLDMRRNLSERSGDVVLSYTTSGASTGPLRVFTLTGFDGTNWRRGDDDRGEPIDAPDHLLWPDREPASRDEAVTMQITVGSLRDTRLPIPTEPRSLDTTGKWNYDAARDEVTGPRTTSTGEIYTATIRPRPLDDERLRKASGPDPDDPHYLEIPRSTHIDDIRSLAEEITKSTKTRYDQALALQTYFRDTNRFTYDPTIPPPTTDDAVQDFLKQRTGYCVQYATAMTVMARTLGIPARLGVGFLPGTEVSAGHFQVTGKDSHTWPELYFPGSGWVRFEPTPAQQTGAAPAYATPLTTNTRDQQDNDNIPVAGQSQAAAPSIAPSPSATGQHSTGARPGTSWLPLGLGALAVLLLAALGIWLARRRMRKHVPITDAEGAWELVRRRLAALGLDWNSSATPRQVPRIVCDRAAELWGTAAGIEAPLTGLAQAVEEARYAQTPRRVDTDELGRMVEGVVVAAQAARSARVSGRPAPDADPSALRVG